MLLIPFIVKNNIVAPGVLSASNIFSSNIVYATGGNSTLWNTTYVSVSSLSANWSNAYTSVNALSANGNTTFNTVSSLSARWTTTHATVSSLSANWSNVYTTVNANSANYILHGGNTKGANIIIGTNDAFNVDIETAGVSKLTIVNATGNVGIGTTAPGAKLTVNGTVSTNNTINGITVGIGFKPAILSNTVIGNLAFNVNDVGINNIAIGQNTLLNSTSGSDNTAIGFEGLKLNITGSQNTAIGLQSLYGNISGNFNTSIGYATMRENIGGKYNTAIGALALRYNNYGDESTAIGFNTLLENRSGIQNTAVGTISLQNNRTGNNNTALGRGTLFTSISSNNNTAIGNNSMLFTISGSNNTAIGESSLLNNTYGENNTAAGFNSLYSNISGSNNVSIGTDAGRYYFTSSNLSNVASTSSIFIGVGSTGGIDAYQTNQVVIGTFARGYGSNTITLGNTNNIRTILNGTSGLYISFGGTTNAFPAIRRTPTVLSGADIYLADASGFAPLQSLYHRWGNGSPEGVVSAPAGALYSNTAGGLSSTLYVKISGITSDATGWRAK